MKEIYEGDGGRELLIEALLRQQMVEDDLALAEKLAGMVELRDVPQGEALIIEGVPDNDLYFILSGAFSITVAGREQALRSMDDHVGEMAAIDPGKPRSATVTARQDAIVAKLSEKHLSEVAREKPIIWRRLAQDLSRRLSQRNVHHTPT